MNTCAAGTVFDKAISELICSFQCPVCEVHLKVTYSEILIY